MNYPAETTPPSRKLLILTSSIFVPVGLLGVLGSFVSFFMFDQPGSGSNPFLYAAVFSMFSLPVMCVVSIPSAWTLHAYKQYKAAKYVALSPLLSIVSFVLMWLFALFV